jgi:Uma2 family endonuclease
MGEPKTLAPVTDRSRFSMHPEDWVTQRDSHDELGAYLKYGMRLLLPDCFVARDLAVYWVPGQTRHPYVGPDLFVARSRPRVEDPQAWLTYEDGPLALVIEIASDKTRKKEPEKRDKIYAQTLQVPEYVYFDLQRPEHRLGWLVEGRYEWISPDAAGRLWSEQFGVGFLWRENERFVRLVGPDGNIVPTAHELEALREEEQRQRQLAEDRATRAARRAAAEAARAEREAEQRSAAEQRAQELAAEVERLRRRLAEGEGNSGENSG